MKLITRTALLAGLMVATGVSVSESWAGTTKTKPGSALSAVAPLQAATVMT